MSLEEHVNHRRSFLDLTSDHIIREAAYPQEEWVKNGGKTTLLGYPALSQDDSPDVEIRGGLLYQGEIIRTVKQDPVSRAKNITAHWQKVESHDYYKWMMENQSYVRAKQKFQNKRNKAKSGKLRSEFSDFRFVRIIAKHIAFNILLEHAGLKAVYADRKQLKQAEGYIIKLQKSFKSGVSLKDFVRQSNLESLLEQLQQEIQIAPRKERATSTSEKRKCIEAVAKEFKLAFDLISPTILNDLAAMIGWFPDHTTIDDVVRKTKS